MALPSSSVNGLGGSISCVSNVTMKIVSTETPKPTTSPASSGYSHSDKTQAEKPAASGFEQFMGSGFPMIIALFVMMYFLMIRPQQKQRKELAARVASMEKGDDIVTAGGMHATVHHISEKTVTLKLSEGVFVPFEKSAIQSVIKKKSSSKEGNSKQSSSEN